MDAEDLFGKRIGHYLLGALIGSGAAGYVYQAIDATLADSPLFAIKCVLKSTHDPRLAQQTAEIVNHKTVIRCPNVVVLTDVLEQDGFFFLVFPFCEMDMFKAIWQEKIYWGNDFLIKKAFLEVLDGVYACHNMGVYHRDLKPENILCDGNGLRIKITDFGLSTDRCISEDGGCGTAPYMSPECWDEHAVYSFPDSMDIWSLGVILFNMVTGRVPWEEAYPTDRKYFGFLCNKDYLLRKYPISEALNTLLRWVWNAAPSGRPTIPAIRQVVLEMDTFYRAPLPFHAIVSPLSTQSDLVDSQETCVASAEQCLDTRRKGYDSLSSVGMKALDRVQICLD